MTFRVGNLWAVVAHKRIRYYRRKPTLKMIAAVERRHAALRH